MLGYIKNFFTSEEKHTLAYTYSGVLRFIPLFIAGGFFVCTILLVAIGPLDWHMHNNLKFYSFTIGCALALILGYLIAVYRTSATQHKVMKINVSHFLYFCVAIALILYFPTVKFGTGKWYPDVYTGITNTGLAYQLGKYYSAYAPKYLFYIRMILAPFTMAIMPITFFYKSRLTKPAFISGIVVIILNVCLSISQGVTKQVADTAMQIIIFLVILMFTEKKKGFKANAKHFTKFIAIILCVCVLFFAYYSNAMKNRLSTDVYLGDGVNTNSQEELINKLNDKHALSGVDLESTVNGYASFSVATERENSIFYKIVPKKIQPMFNYLTSYFCHGYYGLSLAMEQDFTSSYGLGFSDFIRHNVSKFFGGAEFEAQMYERTYMSKITNEGWIVGLSWPTFFVYPASDISFFGVIILVLLIGFLFGLSWKDAVLNHNPFALVSFFGFSTMIFYFSANNQMFQTGENCIGFTVMVGLWVITRIISKIKAKKS